MMDNFSLGVVQARRVTFQCCGYAMTDWDLTEHYLLVLVVHCTLLSSGLSSFVTIYIHEITTILR